LPVSPTSAAASARRGQPASRTAVAPTPPTIEAEGLTKVYGGRPVVDGVSFSAPPGVVFALLGPNGAGKTTLLRLLTTVITATRGRARVCGHDVATAPDEVRRLFAVVPQRSVMSYQLDLRQNVEAYLILAGLPRREARRRGQDVLERFGLGPHARKKPHELSGGLLRRAQLARVLARGTPVLFLDEPTTGLDPAARRDIWEEIRALRSAGRFVLLTTHSLEEAAALADVAGLIDQGRLAAFGPVRDLLAAHAVPSLEELYFRLVGPDAAKTQAGS
jgi:ABC-2 type transport system ATP-binding protein